MAGFGISCTNPLVQPLRVVQLLCFWTLSIVLSLSKKRHPVYFSKHNVSETGFCIRLQVKPQLGLIDRANPYLRTPLPAPRWGVPSQAQHKPSARAKKTLFF
jgi:hypothetical protein